MPRSKANPPISAPIYQRHFAHALIGCMADPAWVIPWERLLTLPDQRIAVIDQDGCIRFASIRLLCEFSRSERADAALSGIHAVYPAPLAAEFLRLTRQAILEDRPHMIEAVLSGERRTIAVCPLNQHGGPGAVLIAMWDAGMWPKHHRLPRPFRANRLGYATLGDLEPFTVSQLDVLRLLGLGHTLGSIAAQLGCSIRTASLRARSLRKGLGAKNNFRLGLHAIQRGLTEISDEQWDRLVFMRRG